LEEFALKSLVSLLSKISEYNGQDWRDFES